MDQNNSSSAADNAIKLTDYFSIVRDVIARWWLILFTAIFTAMCAFVIVTETYAPIYTSSSNLVVYSTDTGTTYTSKTTIAETMASAFSSVISSNAMKGIVNETTGYNFDANMIKTEVITETNLLKVSVNTDNPVESYKILNAILENHNTLTNQIMDNVSLQVLKGPEISTNPANSMKRTQYVALTFVATVVLMIFAEVFFSYRSDTVKSRKDFGTSVEAELLCEIGHEKKYKTFTQHVKREKTSILITNPHTSFGLVETVKKMRTKIEYKCAKTGAKVIMVTSMLENEGKTTISVNLALSLAQKGLNVLLVDGDLRRPAIGKALAIEHAKYGFMDVLKGNVPYTEALMRDSNTGLYLLPGVHGSADVFEKIHGSKIRDLFTLLKTKMDYVIIDTPPMSVVADSEAFAAICDASVLVVRQNLVDVADINDSVDSLKESKSDFLGCVFNNVYSGFGISVGNYSGYSYYNSYGYGGYGGYGYGGGYGGYGSYGSYGSYGGYGGYGKYGKYAKSSEEADVGEEEMKFVPVGNSDSEKKN